MRRDHWDLGTWGRIPVSMHWTVLLSFAWLYIIFWDVTATLFGSVALFLLFIAHEWGHVVMLRRRKVPIVSVMFTGLHGETLYNEYAVKPGDSIAVAWGGVGAQVLVLILAMLASAFIPFGAIPFGMLVWGPMAVVFIKFNVFLMIVALLPIGPFDGHEAWRIIPRLRSKLRRRPKPRKVPIEVQPQLTPEEQRALDEKSKTEADALIARLSGKSGAPKVDR